MLDTEFDLGGVRLETSKQQFASFHDHDLVFDFSFAFHDFHDSRVYRESPVIFYFWLYLLAVCFSNNFAHQNIDLVSQQTRLKVHVYL